MTCLAQRTLASHEGLWPANNPIRTLSYFFEVHFNIIPHLRVNLPSVLFSIRFHNKKPI